MKKYEIVYNKYRDDMMNGYLKKGDQLPSIRESCEIFKMSQTTIERAYSQLLMDGYIINLPQRGYYVSIEEERVYLHRQFDQYQVIHQPVTYLYDLRSQTVSQDSFEMNIWKRYLKNVLDDIGNMSTYGDSQGEYVLREALCQYAYKIRGILSQPDYFLIGSNYQSLLFVLCGLLKKENVIGMETHQQSQAKRVFESYGMKIEMIQVNEEGIDLEDLKKHHIDILYINSASQGLKKKPISKSLRDELLRYTATNKILVIEDDYNGELTYQSHQRHAMHSYSKEDHVIYCGSFSRLLLPSLRISYMILNQKVYDEYMKYKYQYGPMASKLEQLAFSKYIVDGYLEKHLRKLKREYKEKNKMMYQMLKKHIPYQFYLDEAHLCYCIETFGIDEEKLYKECLNHSIAIQKIENHSLNISFASIPLEQIENAVLLLAKMMRSSINVE